jgi:hypothetical protein
MPTVGSAVAYGLQMPGAICTESNFLDDRFCALRRAYGDKPRHVTHNDLTPNGPLAEGDPSAYFVAADGTHHVIFRSHDGHLHELWWTTGPVGQGDLTPSGPLAEGNPSAYFVAADGTHHVIYRSHDGHLHELWWTSGAVGHGDLTHLTNTPVAQSNPSAYFVAEDGSHHVIYRSHDGHLHELWWTRSIVTHNDLTALGAAPPNAESGPSAYFVAADRTHHVIYRSSDGRLHELRWSN